MPDCSPQQFPAIHKVLSIFLTTPVGSVSCKRSFSALRRLKLWTRSSMTEDRLSGLAMLLIHLGTDFIPTPKEIYDMKSNWSRIYGTASYRLVFGVYALCIKTPKSEAGLVSCHFEDENTRDSLACRLGTSNCEVIVFKCRPLLLTFVVCK